MDYPGFDFAPDYAGPRIFYFVAVALPALGFDALCTYAVGAALVVYTDMSGTTLNQAALVFSQYMPVISTMIGFGMLYIVGG